MSLHVFWPWSHGSPTVSHPRTVQWVLLHGRVVDVEGRHRVCSPGK